MAQHSHHVPKFGNWNTESDNVPYTAYFEHARRERERSGIMINPNDPMENPEAFNMCMRVSDDGSHGHGYSHNVNSSENGRQTQQRHEHVHVRGRSRGSNGGSSIKSFSSSRNSTHKSTNSSFNDHANHEATAIPKFGTWDVTDPNSGEGYTAIFSKIKEERLIKSRNVSNISTTPPLNNSNINPYAPSSSWFSKYCCCCFQAKANEGRI